jgi:hypothetical protein
MFFDRTSRVWRETPAEIAAILEELRAEHQRKMAHLRALRATPVLLPADLLRIADQIRRARSCFEGMEAFVIQELRAAEMPLQYASRIYPPCGKRVARCGY